MKLQVKNLESLLNSSEDKNDISKYLILYLIGILIGGVAIFHLKLIKLIADADLNTMLFLRGIFYSICSYLMIRKNELNLPSYNSVGETYWLTIRNVSSFSSAMTLLLTLKYLRLATAVVFTALCPAFAIVFSVVILKEKFYIRYVIGISICMFGCLLMVFNEKSDNKQLYDDKLTNLTSENLKNDLINGSKDKIFKTDQENDLITIMIGTIFGILHSISGAIFNVSSKVLISRKVDSLIIMYYLGICFMIFSFTIGFFMNSHNEVLYNFNFVFNACLSGVLFFLAFHVMNCSFNSNLEVLHTTSINYVQIVQSFIFGALFLNENIYFTDLLGCSIIIAYNILNVMFPIKQ